MPNVIACCPGLLFAAAGARSTPHRYEPLRLFLLVLLWPGLMEPEYHNTIFKKLCSGMNCLTAEQRETLQQWLQEVLLAPSRNL